MMKNSFPWRCPLCAQPLEGGAPLKCPKGHSFDRSAEGYWHLLPVQSKRTKNPGDSREMVAARHLFLNEGYYAPFGEAMAELCLEYGEPTDSEGALHLLDAGCGEGWYDRWIARAFAEADRPLFLAGFDIAKPAVRLAAKGLRSAQYAVASSFDQPIKDEWADFVVNCFSPFAREEFLRVLRPKGRLLYVIPGERHLYGLKEVLYETPYRNPVQEVEYEGFRPLGEREVTGNIRIPSEHLSALFAMTPYFWRTPADGATRLAGLEELESEISFRFLLFEKS